MQIGNEPQEIRTSKQTVDKIGSSKGSGHKWGHTPPVRCMNAYGVANVHKNVPVAHVDERKLAEVRVCREIFESVQKRAK